MKHKPVLDIVKDMLWITAASRCPIRIKALNQGKLDSGQIRGFSDVYPHA